MVDQQVRVPQIRADVAEVLITEEQIRDKVRELGARITADYESTSVTLVSVLKGSLPFMADLMRAIDVPVQIDLMEVSSYGGATTETSGLVRILKDLSSSISGKDVLIVEDIIDTGLTLNYLLRYLRGKNPRSLRICALLDKPARRLVEIPIDYLGFDDPGRVRGRLRPRLQRVLPQPAVHRRAPSRALRDDMTRRALGRGRFLVVVGSLTALVGMVAPWWVVERTGQAALSGNGFEGAGLLVFLAALALLFVVVLPFASRDGESPLDRAPMYIVLALVAVAAYLWRVYEIYQFGGIVPTQTIGLWITGAGLVILVWGVGDILTERSSAY